MTSSQAEMRSHVIDFHADLFGAEQCSMGCCGELLAGLPQLSLEEKASLHCELTEKLTVAVNQMASGRASGIDDFSTDFYKQFFNTLGPDLHGILLKCLRIGSPPVSCQQPVPSLLPKRGDLTLHQNWRTASFVCTDYKVLSTALSNRFKDILEITVHTDQNYCVPEGTIVDNILLIQHVIDVC